MLKIKRTELSNEVFRSDQSMFQFHRVNVINDFGPFNNDFRISMDMQGLVIFMKSKMEKPLEGQKLESGVRTITRIHAKSVRL